MPDRYNESATQAATPSTQIHGRQDHAASTATGSRPISVVSEGHPHRPVVTLEFTREGTDLNVSIQEKSCREAHTLRHYETIPYAPQMIEARCRSLVETR